MEANTVIKARNISKAYGGSSALSGFNLDVHSGQIMGLIGPNEQVNLLFYKLY